THVLLVDPYEERSLGMVRKDVSPNPTWFVLEAFERLHGLGHRIPTPCDDAVLAMSSADGSVVEALVANATTEPMSLQPGPCTASLLTQEGFDTGHGWGEPFAVTDALAVPAGALALLRL